MGSYVGEFLGEMCVNAFFIIAGYSMTKSCQFPRWMGYLGIVVGCVQLVAMFRNVSNFAGKVQDAVNLTFLFPLWLIVLGIGLIRSGREKISKGGRQYER
jgi:hypothetical protein